MVRPDNKTIEGLSYGDGSSEKASLIFLLALLIPPGHNIIQCVKTLGTGFNSGALILYCSKAYVKEVSTLQSFNYFYLRKIRPTYHISCKARFTVIVSG